MAGDDMGCKCGGEYKEKNGKLVCAMCGMLKESKPTYLDLIRENNSLKEMLGKANERIEELERILKIYRPY